MFRPRKKLFALALTLALGCHGRDTAKVPVAQGPARAQLLAREGLRRGLDSSPEVREAVEAALGKALLARAVEVPPVAEDEIDTEYKIHGAGYLAPAAVQVFDLFLPADFHQHGQVEAQRQKAQRIYTQLKDGPPDDFASFAKWVAMSSADPVTRGASGNAGLLSQDQFRGTYGPEALSAVLALTQLGEISAPVQTPRGFYLFKLVKHVPVHPLTRQEAGPRIRDALFAAHRARAEQDFVTALETQKR